MGEPMRQMIVGRITYERPEDGDWWNQVGYGGANPALNAALNEIEQLRLALILADEGRDQ